MDVRLPDGTIIRNVPENITRAELIEKLRRNGYDVSELEKSAPPKREIPNSDPELARLQNRADAAATLRPAQQPQQPEQPTETPYQQSQARYSDVKAQIGRLKASISELQTQYEETGDDATRDAAASLAMRVNELQKQLHGDAAGWGGMIGGAAGSIAGGFAGPAAPLAIPALGTLGGLVGTVIGGLIDAKTEKMTEEEKIEYLQDKAIDSVTFDAIGNVLFMGGGKVISIVKKHMPGYAEAARAAKRIVTPANPDTGLNAPRQLINPAPSVYAETTADELKEATVRGAKILGDGADSTVTRGQLTGEPSMSEKIARVKDRGFFDQTQREQGGRLQRAVSKVVEKVRGPGATYAGTDVRDALEMTEKEVKAYLRPVWDDLAKKHEEIVDFSTISKSARMALDENASRRVPLLKGEELEWTRRLAGGGAKISPAEAQDIASRFSAMARDLDSDIAPNSSLRAFVTDVAAKTRAALDDALKGEPQYAEARDLYKRMMDTVYNPAFKAARRGGESAAGDKVIKIGEVEGIDALRALDDFAREVDTLTGRTALGAKASAARRGTHAAFLEDYAGTPDALAKLPQKMGDPQFRKTFMHAFKDPKDRQLIETLAQAAQTIQRLRGGGGAPGFEAGAASAGRAAGAAVGGAAMANLGSLVTRAASWFMPKTVARALTEPAVKVELPRIARIVQAAAQGTTIAIPESTRKVMDMLDQFAEEDAAVAEQE